MNQEMPHFYHDDLSLNPYFIILKHNNAMLLFLRIEIKHHFSVFTGRSSSDSLGVCTHQPLPTLQAHVQDLPYGFHEWSPTSFCSLLHFQDRQGMR